MNLSPSEEQLMNYIWKLERPFMKDLLAEYPDPKPANTTVATLLKRMQTKGFIDYQQYGNSRQYYALVKKSDYFSKQVKHWVKNFFNNSPTQFASFFTEEADLSEKELEELKNIVNHQIKKRKK